VLELSPRASLASALRGVGEAATGRAGAARGARWATGPLCARLQKEEARELIA
jgi:hypothetical protein